MMDLRLPTTLVAALPLALSLGAASTTPREPMPPRPAVEDSVVGWRVGARPGTARATRDTTEKHGGAASAHFVNPAPTGEMASGGGGGRGGSRGGHGGPGPRLRPVLLEQTLNAIPYRERRVRVSLWVRTKLPEKPVKDMPTSQAHTYIRIENEDGTISSYDGGSISPIFGNTEWTRKVMVISVPPDAFALSFGVGVVGQGEVWVDDAVIDDQGAAPGPYSKQPMFPPEQMQRATPEQIERGKEMLARRTAFMKERPAEVVNGDFETR